MLYQSCIDTILHECNFSDPIGVYSNKLMINENVHSISGSIYNVANSLKLIIN